MVENRPFSNFIAHFILIVGVAVVIFPVYVAFIASTQAPGTFLRGVIPLTPGTHIVDNYAWMFDRGLSRAGAPPIGGMMFNSLIMALAMHWCLRVGRDDALNNPTPTEKKPGVKLTPITGAFAKPIAARFPGSNAVYASCLGALNAHNPSHLSSCP
jgi:hypothetical protein